MKRNMGTTDNGFRILLGSALVGASITELLPAWGWIGVIPLVSAIIWICPLYSLIGYSSRIARIPEPEWFRTVNKDDSDIDFDTQTIPHF